MYTMTPTWLQRLRKSEELIVFVVALDLFINTVTLTVIVPILPEFLYEQQLQNPVDLTSAEVRELSSLDLHTLQAILKERQSKHRYLLDETYEIGFMLASKSLVQLAANPIVGPLTNRVGFFPMMLVGLLVILISTLLFAFGESYAVLFVARAIQGIGSSCSTISGMALLADTFRNDKERSKVMSYALTGLGLGSVFGPPFGAFMYQFFNKTAPFLVICALILLDACLLLFLIRTDNNDRTETKPPSLMVLIRDPYILLAAGGILVANMSYAFLEMGLPIWMMDTMNAKRWELGMALLPSSIIYITSINAFESILRYTGRWTGATIGLLTMALALFLLTLAESLLGLIIPTSMLGLGVGIVEIALYPELGRLVDTRHSSAYETVYAVGDFALCVGFGVGSILGCLIMNAVGFKWMILSSAILQVVYSPLLSFLRKTKDRNDEKCPLLQKTHSETF